jgi:hypothetical protein
MFCVSDAARLEEHGQMSVAAEVYDDILPQDNPSTKCYPVYQRNDIVALDDFENRQAG